MYSCTKVRVNKKSIPLLRRKPVYTFAANITLARIVSFWGEECHDTSITTSDFKTFTVSHETIDNDCYRYGNTTKKLNLARIISYVSTELYVPYFDLVSTLTVGWNKAECAVSKSIIQQSQLLPRDVLSTIYNLLLRLYILEDGALLRVE